LGVDKSCQLPKVDAMVKSTCTNPAGFVHDQTDSSVNGFEIHRSTCARLTQVVFPGGTGPCSVCAASPSLSLSRCCCLVSIGEHALVGDELVLTLLHGRMLRVFVFAAFLVGVQCSIEGQLSPSLLDYSLALALALDGSLSLSLAPSQCLLLVLALSLARPISLSLPLSLPHSLAICDEPNGWTFPAGF
jgi:hypothetical protein